MQMNGLPNVFFTREWVKSDPLLPGLTHEKEMDGTLYCCKLNFFIRR